MMASVPISAPAQPTRADAYAWYVAALLAAGHLVSFIDRFVMSLVLEPLKADLGVSDAQLGLLQGTSFVILYTLAAVPLGQLADRVNRRNLIVVGILVWSVATALCGFATSFWTLFAARVLVGFGEAALVPAAMSLLASYFPRSQIGRAVSLFTAGASLGKSAALIGGGKVLGLLTVAGGLSLGMVGHFSPWQGTFVVMALPGIVLAVLMASVREPARPAVSSAPSDFRAAWAYLNRHRAAFLLHTGAAALTVLTIQSLLAWTPSFYVRYFALTAPQAGAMIGTAVLLSAPLGHLAGGLLIDLFQRRGSTAPAAPVIALGLAGVVPALAVFVTTRDVSVSIVAFAVLSFCSVMAAPASLAGIQMLAPDRLRGALTALFLATTTMIGIGIGPTLIGVSSDLMGGPAFLARAIASVIGVVAVAGVMLALASRHPFAAASAAAREA